MKQYIKSVVYIGFGAALGAFIYFSTGQSLGLVVAALGAFIGFGLSLPGTSLTRVAKGTAGAIVAHNLPSPLRSKAIDAFLGEGESEPGFSSAAARSNHRKLRRRDIITVTDEAVLRLQKEYLPPDAKLPLRIVAEINKENPCFLYYAMSVATEWDLDRDILCVVNEMDFIMDQLTAVRMKGTVLEWIRESERQGFSFDNPTWPRKDLSQEPWESEIPQQPPKSHFSLKVAGGAIALALLFIVVVKLPVFMAQNAKQQGTQRQIQATQAKQLETQSDQWNEKIERGEDVPDAILFLAGIDPAKYKERQKQLREQDQVEDDDDSAPHEVTE